MSLLADRTVLITGAARGIGLASDLSNYLTGAMLE